MLIAVLGATGYVGMALVRHVHKSDRTASIKVAGRNRTKLAALQTYPNVSSTHVYEQGQVLDAILAGADACIDLSYQTGGTPSKQIRESKLHAHNLVQACQRQKIRNLIIVGSVAEYGMPVISYPWTAVPRPHDLRFPTSVYSRVKAVVEECAVRDARNLNLNLALIRSGHILGPGSKMASNIAGGLLRQDCLLLSGISAPSNATTVDGLVSTLLNLAVSDWDTKLLISNHVNLGKISYDDLVSYFSQIMNTEALSGASVDVAAPSLTNRFLQQIRRHEGRLSVLQSYFGLSEGIVDRIKQLHRTEKSAMGLGSEGNTLQCSRILPLYLSSRVPHSQASCGALLEPEHLSSKLVDVQRWLEATGFVGNIEF
jgi:nucleoside-diphosphate-sugar epimerase